MKVFKDVETKNDHNERHTLVRLFAKSEESLEEGRKEIDLKKKIIPIE